ncbi:MAG: 3-hydroxyacyl-CoA dehydrogenase family protein [Promethearchaeota archaeon]|nr:MAG: 3-hydroxyacyl-CoA dehydrogenase family protein [Candidatus Lokiarchaeota archaeon]
MVDLNSIKAIAVIGAGTMGREIAQVALMAGFEKVFLYSRSIETITKAKNFIVNGLKKLESKDYFNEGVTPELLMKNLILNRDLEKTVENADFVIESVPENMDLKQEIFKKLGNFAPKHAILATNTSTMSITKIAEASGRADKVIGMHFFTPIIVLRLIEVIKGANTSKETFDIGIAIGEKFPALKGKRYIAKIEKESPGFIVNRLTISTSLYLNWLLDLAMEKGIPIETIDNDVVSYPAIGPFAKWDYFGIDVVCDTRNYFAKELSPEFTPGKTLKTLLKEGKLGKKTGKGIYEWKEGIHMITSNEKANIFNLELYYAIQLNEGCRLLEEGIVSGYKIIDDTMIAGMDMPGPFAAGKRNYKKWTKLLDDFVKRSGLKYLKPCNLMKSGEFINMKK